MSNPAQVDVTQDARRCEDNATRVVAVLDGYLAALKAGQQPDREQLLAANPEIAEQLQACLAGIEFIHSGSNGTQPSGKRLGQFRIIREIGHGGMGAVYEAEQITLGRRVALKVLRFGSVSDDDAIERFKREAETVGKLHHTNIVPIFDIGSEHGVNYYAMQYIVGRSLDQVLREAGKPIDPHTVAQWGLQAAEALAHAHTRGVIHRDVKPSNLLIDDEEGRIWLTDFGLAKRMDDVTLSMTGALLGTPRYMSPEQAMAAHSKLDHRTDLYSLGATLYELATNKPVFTGDTPHDVISQIIGRDPVPPRQHRPSLPRDLETICMKCLAKESSQRYASASQLADDLRAFLEGRPISARRASLVELAGRWLKQQQRSLVLTIGAVAVTLLLVAAATAGRYFWQRSQLAFVRLDTDHPPVVAEILNDAGVAVLPRVTVPMQQPGEVASGEYRLRLTTDQRLSQEYDVSLAPGQQLHQKLDVEDQLLWGDLKYGRTYRVITVREQNSERAKADLLLLNADTLQRCDGATRETKWTLNLAQPTHELLTKQVRILWPWDRNNSIGTHGVGVFDQRPWVVSVSDAAEAKGSFDFNADGITDVIIAARHQAWMLALSGKDGTPLWVVSRGDSKPSPEGQTPQGSGLLGGVPYPPLNVGDHDGDGIADLAVWFMTATFVNTTTVTRTLELVSGATGATIWSYEPPAEWFALPNGENPPLDFRWFYGYGGGYGSGGGGGSWNGPYTRRSRGMLHRDGQNAYLPSAPQLLANSKTDDADDRLAFLCGAQLVRLDPTTGKDGESPAELPLRSTLMPRWADFDGDGQVDLLLVNHLPDLPATTAWGHPIPQLQLTAWSSGKRQKLWQQVLEANLPSQPEMSVEAPAWPIVADIDGDGASELIVPTASGAREMDWKPPFGVLSVLNGRTGEPKWQRQLRNIDQQLDTFTVGPDIDGDGQREVYVASLWNEDYRLFLDCFSGADGKSLWRTVQPTVAGTHSNEEHRFLPLTWYADGEGGDPQLLLRLKAGHAVQSSLVGLFSAQSGKQAHLATGIVDAQPSDFDGDGVTDLLLTRAANFQHNDEGGVLHVFRGVVREPWRRLGTYTQPTFDFNSDGVTDLLETPYGRKVTARCGATGQALWIAELPNNFTVQALPPLDSDPAAVLAAQDFNRDGTCDVVLFRTNGQYGDGGSISLALSGVDGRILWQSQAVCNMLEKPAFSDVRDLDGDGEAEVICVQPLDYDRTDYNLWSSNDTSLWLAVLSSRTGKTRFIQKLVGRNPNGFSLRIDQLWLEAAYADLNRDGTLDLLLPGLKTGTTDQLELQAISGKNGSRLWQFPLPPDQQKQEALSGVWPAAAGDVDGDGQPEVVIGSLTDVASVRFGSTTVCRLALLDGASGKQRWQQDIPSERYYARVDQADRVVNRPRPILLRRPDKQQWIAVLSLSHMFALNILDAEGNMIVDRNLYPEPSLAPKPQRLWACDIDGDERDELVLFENESLRVARPDDLEHPLWSADRSAWRPGAVKGVLRGPEGPQLLLEGGPVGASLFGLSAATGKTLWTCVAPGGQLGSSAALLRHPSKDAAPLAFYHNINLTIVREAMLLQGRTRAASPERPHLAPVEHDPRLLRDLPWQMPQNDLVQSAAMFGWSVFYGLTLAAIPAAFVISLIRWRKWGMRTMLMLPVVAAIFLMGMLVAGPSESEFRSLPGKYLLALFGAPILVAAFILVRWAWQRKFVPVVAWLSVGLVLVLLALAALALGVFPKLDDLTPDERLSWAGWYWVFFPCYFATACGMTVLVPPWWMASYVWKRCRHNPHKLAPQ